MRACHFQVMDPGRIDRSVVPRPSPGSKSGWHQSTVRVHVRVPRRPLPAVRARERRGEERGTIDQIEAKGPVIILFALLKRQAEKYCWLICCEQRTRSVNIMEPYIASNFLLLQLPILFAVAQLSIDRSIGGWASPSPSYMLLSDRFHLL
jgi:hypothetical protein